MRKFWIFLIYIGLLFPSLCLAHKISAFLDIERNKVTIFTYFSDGTPLKNGKIEVYTQNGTLIFKGKTNKEGECSFYLRSPGVYKLVVIGELGHKAEKWFEIKNFLRGEER